MMEGEKNRDTEDHMAMGKYATVEGARSQERREDMLRQKEYTWKDKKELASNFPLATIYQWVPTVKGNPLISPVDPITDNNRMWAGTDMPRTA